MNNRHFHRRNLPHLYYDEGIYFITFRLNDSIPLHLLAEGQKDYQDQKLKDGDINETKRRLFVKYDNLLDTNLINCDYLTRSEITPVIKNSLHFYDNKDYSLLCYYVMPNHVHVVFELLKDNRGISNIMHSIKRYSARECNKILKQDGYFWQHESYDRLVRNEKELYFTTEYILNNPVKAGLVEKREDWPHSYCNMI